jgi:hypothetical protein
VVVVMRECRNGCGVMMGRDDTFLHSVALEIALEERVELGHLGGVLP